MTTVYRSWLVLVAVGCGGADRSLDVDALTARDLLGVEPAVALAWDDGERQRAAETIEAAARAGGSEAALLGYAEDRATAILASVTDIDFRRSRAGDDVIAFARASLSGAARARVIVEAAPPDDGEPPPTEIAPSGWPEKLAPLLSRDPDRLAAIAAAAGHPAHETLFVSPAAREPFAALYLAERRQLLVNPVYLATLEPVAESTSASVDPGSRAPSSPPPRIAPTSGGNPYSFYGSIAECAADHRLRCDGCAGTGTCESVTRDSDDGDAECEAFAADNERGFYLFCANLSAAIATVADCVDDVAPACPVNRDAGNLLAALDANTALIDDPVCLEATDACLADLFGDPDGDFGDVPGSGDPPPPPPPPPRRVDFGCGDNEIDCDFAPQIGCSSEGCASGPSCGGCDGGCEGGGCDTSCDGGSGCDSGCDSGSCEGGSCDGCDSGSGCEGGSCDGGGCDSGGGCEGGSCDSGSGCDSGGSCDGGGGSCGGGGGSCGGSGGGGSCGGGGGSQCSVTRRRATAGWGGPLVAGLLPLLIIGRLRQRERRRRDR